MFPQVQVILLSYIRLVNHRDVEIQHFPTMPVPPLQIYYLSARVQIKEVRQLQMFRVRFETLFTSKRR